MPQSSVLYTVIVTCTVLIQMVVALLNIHANVIISPLIMVMYNYIYDVFVCIYNIMQDIINMTVHCANLHAHMHMDTTGMHGGVLS